MLCILLLFKIIVAKLSLKNTWLPPIFFLNSNSRYQDLLFSQSDKPGKNTSLLVGTVLKYDVFVKRSQKSIMFRHFNNEITDEEFLLLCDSNTSVNKPGSTLPLVRRERVCGVAVFWCKQFRPFNIFLGRNENHRYN